MNLVYLYTGKSIKWDYKELMSKEVEQVSGATLKKIKKRKKSVSIELNSSGNTQLLPLMTTALVKHLY